MAFLSIYQLKPKRLRVNFTNTKTTTNFSSSYTIGFPTGIDILKSDKIGFSFEFVPTIRSEKGVNKVTNFEYTIA